MQRLAACCCFCCASDGQPGVEKASSARRSNGENRPAGVELVNDLIKTEWKHVSDWFQEQMSTKVANIVEDLLKKWHPTIGVVIPREKCTLGKAPLVLERVQSSTIAEVLPDGTPIETMRITSQVDFTSDAELDFVFERVFGMGGNASMKVDGVRIKGTLIIELVHLSKDPPWFSAVRVYFPDLPSLDFSLEPHVLGTFGESILPLGFIKAKIVMALTESVIGKFAVLPNRFCVPLGDRIQQFPLKHAHPAGVLRVIVEEAENLRNPGSGWWSMRKGDANASPYVQLWAGSQSARTCARKEEKTLKPKWRREGQPYEVHDLLIAAPQMQSLKVRVCDDLHGLRSVEPSPLLGQAETAIREYVKGSKGGRERFQLIASDSGRAGAVWLCIEWRPFAEASAEDTDASPWLAEEGESTQHCWSYGPPLWSRHALLLSVHLYCGIGLPHDEDEKPHYASVSVCAMKAGKFQEQRWTPEDYERRSIAPTYAVARTPEDHGEHLIKSKCGESASQVLDDGNRRRLARHLWRTSLWIPHDKLDIDGTDAVWDAPFRFMVDSLENVKVRFVVGTGEASGKDDKIVLKGELKEAKLREMDFGNMEPTCYTFTCNDGGIFTQRESQLKLVVHVRRLQPPVKVQKTRTALAKQAFLGRSLSAGNTTVLVSASNGTAASNATASRPRSRWFPLWRSQVVVPAANQAPAQPSVGRATTDILANRSSRQEGHTVDLAAPLTTVRERADSSSSAIPRWQFWRRRPPAATDVPADVPATDVSDIPEIPSAVDAPLQTSYFTSRDIAG